MTRLINHLRPNPANFPPKKKRGRPPGLSPAACRPSSAPWPRLPERGARHGPGVGVEDRGVGWRSRSWLKILVVVGLIKPLGVQRLLIQWPFRKDHCFTRDLHQQFQGTIILMVFDLQGDPYFWGGGTWPGGGLVEFSHDVYYEKRHLNELYLDVPDVGS